MSQDKQNELQLENLYLERTIAEARKQWMLARQKSRERETAISLAHEEMLDSAPQTVSSFYSRQGFQDLAELSQYAQPVSDQISAYENEAQIIQSLEKMMDSPYFARIDFHFDGEETADKIYIGRRTLMVDKSLEIFVHDWRAPASSVFYRFGIGKASFEAPAGTVTGEVELKRQYEVRQGKLAYFFDADVQIVDEFLKNLLSKNASPTMKTIVETIQKDQDIVIRDMQSDVLMVQGTAGSGKTSIALHRIAYLMYEGLKGKLSASDILILSPNAVFEEYIAHVLPELGENSVKTMLLEDIFQNMLPNSKMWSRGHCLEHLLACKDAGQAEIIKSSTAFKGSMAFAEILNRLVLELPRKWIPFQDIDYDGQCIVHRDAAKAAICNPKKIATLGMRLKWLEREILEQVHSLRKGRIQKLEDFMTRYPEHAMEAEEFARWMSIEESAVLLREIRTFTSIDCLAVYRRLFHDKARFYRLAEGIALPENIEEIRRFTCARLSEDRLWYEDAAALTYLNIRVYGCEKYRHIRQLVLDEAQDEQLLHFAIIRELFPNARYTILGDVNQAIGKQADLSLYGLIGSLLGREKTSLVTMEKSFRCTMEIWRFSTKFLAPGFVGQCFSRSGEEPAIHAAPGMKKLEELLIREVAACKEKGYQSIGLILKTGKDAAGLYERLKGRMDMRLIHNDSIADLRGTLIMPVYLAKGLEFDTVLVCDADSAHYQTEDDKRLLYVASTRALHRLNLFYTGDISPLLK